MKKIIHIFVFLILYVTKINASHIVGGSISYICLGNNTYEFTVNIYRDCLPPEQGGGNPAALQSDNPAFITIYRGTSFFSFDSIYASSSFNIPPNFSNDCVNNPPATCLNRLQFKFIKVLPQSPNNYTVLYQRCCRNETVNNLVNPGNTGASYSCTVPGTLSPCNSSAEFKNYPPQIICVNNPFVYDHSATDPDSDSLVYYFCNALRGGDPSDPKPINIGGNIPNITPVQYRTPYTSLNPLGGNPILAIDSKTGIITGTPNILGRFVVNVCCDEYRNGVKINTNSREFQFVVTNCSKAVVANIPQFSSEPNTYIVNCKDYTVNFKNISTGGFEYDWDFGVPGIGTDISKDFEPTYTYPDTGTYVVTLKVNYGSTCPDSIKRIVKIYPTFDADFDYIGQLCPNFPIQFNDKSTSSLLMPNKWSWNFDDGNTSDVQNPTHAFSNVGKDYIVTLIAGNSYGCLDTSQKTLKIPKVNVFAGNDTVIVKDLPFQFNGTGAVNYTWSPGNNMDNPNIYNPIVTFTNTGIYDFLLTGITSNGCTGTDDIKITVADEPYIIVPNAFSPNGDGLNDILKILSAGFKKLKTFKIYNRWGALVYSTTDFRKGWDGTFNGKDCEIGTYFWLAEAVDIADRTKMIKGDIILVR